LEHFTIPVLNVQRAAMSVVSGGGGSYIQQFAVAWHHSGIAECYAPGDV
jgi:hypothetical protein